MSSGQIFIISNEIYSQYGSNVYMIGSSSIPRHTIDILSTAFVQPFDIHFISSKSDDIDHILTIVFDELKYNQIKPNKQLFMLPNLQMVQQKINDIIVDLLNRQNLINEKNILGDKIDNRKVINPSKPDNKKCDVFIDDEPICMKPINKNCLDADLTDSDDEEDIKTFRNLLQSTECEVKTKTNKKAITKKIK